MRISTYEKRSITKRKIDGKDRYVCKQCEKPFTHQSSLSKHSKLCNCLLPEPKVLKEDLHELNSFLFIIYSFIYLIFLCCFCFAQKLEQAQVWRRTFNQKIRYTNVKQFIGRIIVYHYPHFKQMVPNLNESYNMKTLESLPDLRTTFNKFCKEVKEIRPN